MITEIIDEICVGDTLLSTTLEILVQYGFSNKAIVDNDLYFRLGIIFKDYQTIIKKEV